MIDCEEMLTTLDQTAFESLDTRLIKYLNDKKTVLESNSFNITHQQIATELNSSREAISRLLKKLEGLKVIKLGRNKIEMLKDLNKGYPSSRIDEAIEKIARFEKGPLTRSFKRYNERMAMLEGSKEWLEKRNGELLWEIDQLEKSNREYIYYSCWFYRNRRHGLWWFCWSVGAT